MSKSVGNIASLAEVLDEHGPEVTLAVFLTSHYRSRLPLTDDRIAAAAAACERLSGGARALGRAVGTAGAGYDAALAGVLVETRERFFAALADDLGTPAALAALFDLVRASNGAIERGEAGADQLREVRRELVDLLDVLGLAALAAEEGPIAVPNEVMDLLAAREDARAARDFARADEVRDRIAALGWSVTDTPDGPQVRPASGPHS
jgi:cysteinyl-tRNA synthetase